MALSNQWVTYLERSYKTIKTAVLTRMKTLVPEMTDHSESNIFVIIISLFSGLVEQLNYYIDNLARELYISTARRYSSLIKITRLIDYRVRAKIASTADLKVIAVDSSGDPVNLVANFTFNSNLIVKTESGIEFITTAKATILANTSTVILKAKQVEHILNQNIGTTTSSPYQTYKLSSNYEHDSLQITINTYDWTLKQTLAFSGPTDRHFIVNVNEAKEAWVVFGDDINGAIPPTGQTVYASFYETLGASGNVQAETINTWASAPTPPVQVPAISSFIIYNPLESVGGINEEDVERIRKHAPLSLRTLDRAVTAQDFKDISELVPGVGKVAVYMNPKSKKLEVYVAPEEGGTATLQLLDDVKNELDIKGIIGAVVETKAAGETILRLTLTITAKFRRSKAQTEIDVISALIQNFGFNASDVNKKIRTSDIIALIDNLEKVDFLTLDVITTKPYPRIYSGSNPLSNNWLVNVTENSVATVRWRIGVSDSANAVIYRKEGSNPEVKDGDITIHVSDPGDTDYTSQDGSLELAMWGTFSTGDQWVFYTYAYNKDIEFVDFTVPVIDVDELTITVNEQLIIQ